MPAGVAQVISHGNRCPRDGITEGTDGPHPFSRCFIISKDAMLHVRQAGKCQSDGKHFHPGLLR